VIQGDRIAAVAHDGHGCTLSIAAASMIADRLVGLDIAAARALVAEFDAMVAGDGPIAAELGELAAFAGVRAFRSRRACASLPGRALIDALAHQPHC
jgi:nitrogen fixation protein NifU and related proteins